MPIYKGSTNQGLIYYGSPNTNCLTSVPKNVKLELTYGAWTQPIFSSNTNGGLTLSASHESTPAWYAFNGDKTTNDNCWWTNHGVTSTSNPCWIQLKSAIKLKLNQVVIRNEHQTPENFKTAYLQVSNDGSSWTNVVTISGTNTGGYETTVNFTVSDGYYYYRLYFTESYSSGGVSIQTITFSGTAQNILTLKAGSKVYVPNGFESDGTTPKFDVVTIESDRTLTRTINGTYFVTANIVGGTNITDARLVSSGTNPTPASYSLQYNTTSNEIKRYSDSTSSYTKDSFPVAIVTVSNSSISSVDQIFDWCGFIGSTAFVLPGVKGLIPNGFNVDGTYKSIEFTTDRVLTTTRTWDVTVSFIQKLFIYNRGKALGIQNYQIESDSMPTANDWTVWYNPKENIQRWNNSSNTLTDISQWTVDTTMRYIGEIPSDGTSRITSLVPTTVQPLSTGITISNVYKGSTLVYENKLPAGQIVFEQAVAGTYTVTLPKTQNYRLIMVGGGGGGASGGSGHYTNYNAGGGSGGYVEVIVKLNKGSYTVSVGAIGAHGSGSSAGLYYGTAGGNTTAFGFTAGGGQGGRCSIHSGGPLGGAGGSNTLATYVQLVANTTGNTGATSGGSYNVSGGASVYGSYGRGQNAYGDAGVAGYIKIVTA